MVGATKLPYVPPTPSPLDEEVEKAAKLASQWPKAHVCKVGLIHIPKERWATWPLYSEYSDPYGKYQLKHCPTCGSTLMVAVDISDLGAE